MTPIDLRWAFSFYILNLIYIYVKIFFGDLMTKNKTKIGIIQMVICSVLWSTAGLFINKIDLNPFAIAGYRGLIAGITILIFMLIAKIKIVVNKKSLVSMVFVSATAIFFVLSTKLSTAANAIVLQYTAPIYIVVFSWLFFKKKPKTNDLITVLITMLGIVLFFVDSLQGGHLLGNIFGLLAGVCMGMMFVFVGECNKDEKLSGIMLSQFLTAIIGILSSLFFEKNFTTDLTPVLCLLFLGVFQLGIPYALYGLANTNCPALLCCLIAAIEPVLNPVLVALVTKEIPSTLAIISGAVVILTITINCVLNAKKPQPV